MHDPVLQYVEQHARAKPWVERVSLFGSRARGDSHVRSDYDLAVWAPKAPDEEWAKWALELRESVPTLCGLDLVRGVPGLAADLVSAIGRDGKVIYERK